MARRAKREQGLFDPRNVAAKDGGLGEGTITKIEINGWLKKEADSAVDARPKFYSEVSFGVTRRNQSFLLNILIEPAFLVCRVCPLHDFARRAEEEDITVENEQPVTLGKMNHVKDL